MFSASITDYLQQVLQDLWKIPLFFNDLVSENINDLLPLFHNGHWWELAKDIFSLSLMIIIPIILFKKSRQWTKKLSQNRRQSYFSRKKSTSSKLSEQAAIYLPWGMLILTFFLLKELIQQTIFTQWSFIFTYFIAFGFYRLIIVFLNKYYIRYKASLIEHNKRVKRTILLWTGWALAYFIVTHFVDHVVQDSYLSQLVDKFYFLIGLVLFLRSSWRWREESFRTLSSLPFIGKVFQFLTTQKWSYIFLPVIMILALVKSTLSMLISIFSEQEIFKRLSTQIVKTKLKDAMENEEKSNYSLPLTYEYLFNQHSINDKRFRLTFPGNLLLETRALILEWYKDREEEHSMAIIGSVGSGKSSLLKTLSSSRLNKSYKSIYHCVSNKITHPKQINQLISRLFDCEYSGGVEELIKIDNELQPTIVVLDNCHNLFLAKEDGLEGLKYFIQIINAETKNLFWITAFNNHSWFYINNVLGKHRFFRHEKNMPKWSDEDIARLIKKRHSFSDYELSFELITEILSTDEDLPESKSEIESKFFRLLSEQSRGRPRLAQKLWLSALRAQSYKKLRVAMPGEFELGKKLSDMQDYSLFVYAALLRHENLSIRQASQVTSLPKGIVSNALKLGLERKFLIRDQWQQYRVIVTHIDALTSFLAKKNFVYE